MYFFAILFTLASAAASWDPKSGKKSGHFWKNRNSASKYMPNIEYFLRGYNIMKGNPHQTSVSAVDPGFQEPIFRLSYDQGTVTPDDKYFSPDGTLVTTCQACSLSAVTKKISGMNSYRDSLSEKVKISEEICIWWWCPYRFSWSVDYKKVQTEIHQYSNFYTHSDASCCAYQVQTDLYKPPPFSSDFLRGIISLPENYTPPENKALYRKFIDSFGTNYIKQTDMGSLFGQEIKISKESWTKMLNQSINIDWSASWSTFFALYVDENGKYQQEQKQVDKFNNLTSSRSLYTKGSKPPKDGSLANWVTEAKDYPAPIALELGSMLDLFTSLKVPQPIVANMNESLYNYCDNNTCKDLKDDQNLACASSWQRWLTTFTAGSRSPPNCCNDGDYVIKIQLARDDNWYWESDGLYELRFACSTRPDQWISIIGKGNVYQPTYRGLEMSCFSHGFKKMSTYRTDVYHLYPINVRAQCVGRYTLPQYAFIPPPPLSEWDNWVICDPGKKIVGFQVMFGTTNRIMNFRFSCA